MKLAQQSAEKLTEIKSETSLPSLPPVSSSSKEFSSYQSTVIFSFFARTGSRTGSGWRTGSNRFGSNRTGCPPLLLASVKKMKILRKREIRPLSFTLIFFKYYCLA